MLWGDDDCRAHVYFFGGSLRRRKTPCETATRRWDNKRRGRHGELIWNGDLKGEICFGRSRCRVWGSGGKVVLYKFLQTEHGWDSRQLLCWAEKEVGIVEVSCGYGFERPEQRLHGDLYTTAKSRVVHGFTHYACIRSLGLQYTASPTLTRCWTLG
jgi:hypothetical protein